MLEKKEEHRISRDDAEEVKEILGVVSKEVPALIKNLIASVFSEEAGRNMGKAAAAFYKELKDSGMPNELALKMTEDYMSTFTSLGNVFKQINIGKGGDLSSSSAKELEREIRDRLEKKLAEKRKEKGARLEEEEEVT